jgi:enterochelin esterase-like enzyme
MRLFSVIFSALSLASCSISTQEKSSSVQEFRLDTLSGIASRTLIRTHLQSDYIEDRSLDIWLPSSYDEGKKHNVLYIFDGQMLFDSNNTWNGQEWCVDEIVDSLINEQYILPTIVVGLYNGGMSRSFEYFPQNPATNLNSVFADSLFSNIAYQHNLDLGYAINSDNYLKYVVVEVKPFIDSSFHVKDSAIHNAIMGSSMGGLMSLYAIGEYPDIFGTSLCLSTHWPGGFSENNQIPQVFASYIKEYIQPDRVGKIYFDYGTETLDSMYGPIQKKMDVLLTDNGFNYAENWVTREFLGAAHDEQSWSKRLHIPLIYAFGRK